MTRDRIRVGVIGVGFGAQVHIPAFKSEGLDVVAVSARRHERAAETADQFEIPHVFTDYREMLRMDNLDAVSIVSPPSLHHSMTLAALESGKHVLCEKPFATDKLQALEMWRMARNTGLTAMIAHEFRFASARMMVKELIDQGYLGPLSMVLMSLIVGPRRGFQLRPATDRDDASQGGGFLFALGAHYIDCLRHWFGEITSVFGKVVTHAGERIDPETQATINTTADDTFHFWLSFENGGWASMTGTTAAPFGNGARVEIFGRDGTLITPHSGQGFNPPAHGTLLGARTGDEGLSPIPIPERLQPFSDDRDERLMPFRLLTREFIRGIQEGVSPAPNFHDGYRCQQVLDAIRESSRIGQVVPVDLADV